MQNKTEIIMPDFEEWACLLLDDAYVPESTKIELGDALKQAFTQGYTLGKREGMSENGD